MASNKSECSRPHQMHPVNPPASFRHINILETQKYLTHSAKENKIHCSSFTGATLCVNV